MPTTLMPVSGVKTPYVVMVLRRKGTRLLGARTQLPRRRGEDVKQPETELRADKSTGKK